MFEEVEKIDLLLSVVRLRCSIICMAWWYAGKILRRSMAQRFAEFLQSHDFQAS